MVCVMKCKGSFSLRVQYIVLCIISGMQLYVYLSLCGYILSTVATILRNMVIIPLVYGKIAIKSAMFSCDAINVFVRTCIKSQNVFCDCVEF